MAEGLANYLGTIDLDNREVYRHPDGYIQTEHSFSFSPDGKTEILVPSIVGGKPVSNDEAIKHFYNTGEHLGTFNKDEEIRTKGLSEQAFYDYLNGYADSIHKRQEKFYGR